MKRFIHKPRKNWKELENWRFKSETTTGIFFTDSRQVYFKRIVERD